MGPHAGKDRNHGVAFVTSVRDVCVDKDIGHIQWLVSDPCLDQSSFSKPADHALL